MLKNRDVLTMSLFALRHDILDESPELNKNYKHLVFQRRILIKFSSKTSKIQPKIVFSTTFFFRFQAVDEEREDRDDATSAKKIPFEN